MPSLRVTPSTRSNRDRRYAGPVGSGSTRPWIDGLSASAVRDAVRAVVPDLAGAPVELNVALEPINPYWQRGTAWLGNAHVVKFAWSAEAAVELARERHADGL
jgi:hypothetical protein